LAAKRRYAGVVAECCAALQCSERAAFYTSSHSSSYQEQSTRRGTASCRDVLCCRVQRAYATEWSSSSRNTALHCNAFELSKSATTATTTTASPTAAAASAAAITAIAPAAAAGSQLLLRVRGLGAQTQQSSVLVRAAVWRTAVAAAQDHRAVHLKKRLITKLRRA
jgi:hypothetical protein